MSSIPISLSPDLRRLREGVVEEPDNFDFQAPTEGVPINSDAYCIPADAEHPGTVHEHLRY